MASKAKAGKRKRKTRGLALNPKVNRDLARVVVDEIFEDGTVRLLKAPRLIEFEESERFGMDTWGDEREQIMSSWRVGAFMGLPSARKLQEGDVFFIRNASSLNNTYKPIALQDALNKHLLKSWDESRETARTEIKREFYRLSAVQMAREDKGRQKKLLLQADKAISSEMAVSKQKTKKK